MYQQDLAKVYAFIRGQVFPIVGLILVGLSFFGLLADRSAVSKD